MDILASASIASESVASEQRSMSSKNMKKGKKKKKKSKQINRDMKEKKETMPESLESLDKDVRYAAKPKGFFNLFGKKSSSPIIEEDEDEEEDCGESLDLWGDGNYDEDFAVDDDDDDEYYRGSLASSDEDSSDDEYFFNEKSSSSLPSSNRTPEPRPLDDYTIDSILEKCQLIIGTMNFNHMWSWDSSVFQAMSTDQQISTAIVESMGILHTLKGSQRKNAFWEAVATSMAVALIRALLDTFTPYRDATNLFNEMQQRQQESIDYKLSLAQDTLREFQHQEPNLFGRMSKAIHNMSITSFIELGFYVLESSCSYDRFVILLNDASLKPDVSVLPSSMSMCSICLHSYDEKHARVKCTRCPLVSICDLCHKKNEIEPTINHPITHAFEKACANNLTREDSIETVKFLNSLV
eukprot:TRINITY_DN1132_c0_g3_i1.p1 TRINITY_DN1132_c0_g3~~TRINITY_DN1132_c0_g3_i1.p1  ORF type:complete len:424 (+),score=151.89 TRINITY_DN1132_c0_g3_i1:40-1272(+)